MSEPRVDNSERTLNHIETQLEQVIADLRVIKSAFPEDEFGNVDTLGHRGYHEEMIAGAKAQTRFWQDLRNELVKKGLLWAIIIALGLMGSGLMMKTGITWGAGK